MASAQEISSWLQYLTAGARVKVVCSKTLGFMKNHYFSVCSCFSYCFGEMMTISTYLSCNWNSENFLPFNLLNHLLGKFLDMLYTIIHKTDTIHAFMWHREKKNRLNRFRDLYLYTYNIVHILKIHCIFQILKYFSLLNF